MIAIAIVNYRTADATLACIDALRTEPDARIFLLDNASGDAEARRLRAYADAQSPRIRFIAAERNLGFAAGNNRLLGEIHADPAFDQVLLLNSDTQPQPGFLAAMQARLDPGSRIDMIAARMLGSKDGNVDSLGIALYRSTLASNRKQETDMLLGPSGGCALFTRRVLEDLHTSHGEWFDETFFCYAEDTDLAARARWLGYTPAYAADAVVLHEGSLSSGGPENDFVLYHGIRNSLWWLAKNAPPLWLLRSIPWFILLHAGIIARHLRRGRARVLWRLYRDAICGVPAMLKKRKVVRAMRRVPAREFTTWVTPRFYERDYLRRAWRELWRGAQQE